MSKAKIKQLDIDDVEKTHLQQTFLDAFLKYGKFTAACNILANTSSELTEATVGQWIEEDTDFKAEFEKAKRIVARVGAVKAEEFLNQAGSGLQKTGKDSGISNANVIAAHMVLEADDKAKWSSKVAVEKTETRTITTIVKHYDGNETKTETIDCPEVKVLSSGNGDNE